MRDAEPIVDTCCGAVCGVQRPGSAAFLGIPFAEPPVGWLRFAVPEPRRPWSGVRDATRPGATPQRRPFGPVTTIPEPSFPGDDTLNVNVFTPAPGDRQAKLPVLVWIHGGGFFAGSPSSPWYDGAPFNQDGVVTVSVSYRLGFDGFGWIDGVPANRGILDQIAALRWVRDNIAAFGGDPDRVTIAGQSAGAASVLALLAAPAADGLFRGAIAASPVVIDLLPDRAAQAAARVAASLGLSGTALDDWRGVDEDRLLAAEREEIGVSLAEPSLPLADYVRTLGAGDALSGLTLAPVVDGETLFPLGQRLRSGVHRDTLLLIGSAANEFPGANPETVDRVALDEAFAGLGASGPGTSRFWAELDLIGADSVRAQLTALRMFRLSVATVAQARAAGSAAANTWSYDFRYHAPSLNRAAHCFDLPYAWNLGSGEGVIEALGEPADAVLSAAVHSAWLAVITGASPEWPSTDASLTGGCVFDRDTAYDPDAYRLEAEIATELP
ncbi:MAG: carboxylesterase family protein [Micropruina sp.]|uniref:carboxylesterase family protein n=1 Tax=Micropruina sp. TaxID=2737536 RepID=UPI0039E42E8B